MDRKRQSQLSLHKRIVAGGCLAFALAGCGDSGTATTAGTSAPAANVAVNPASTAPITEAAPAPASTPAERPLATASIPAPATKTAETPAGGLPFATEGSVEWRLFQITDLIAPPATRKEVVAADGSRTQLDRTPEEITRERQSRLAKVADHAGQIIARTHADPSQEAHFLNAVHYLCSAQVELAVLGNADSARKLGEVADAIFQEKPQSEAAATSSYALVTLSQKMAELYGRQNPDWVRAQSRQARLFVERFPKETSRSAVALIDAARACERAGLPTDARDCLRLIADRFPNTPFAEEIVPDLRRLNLEGRTLTAQEFGGPTIDGGFLSVEHLRGRHVLVAFWMTDSPTFAADLPVLQQLEQQHGDKLMMVGVNLDTDEAAVDKFIEEHGLGWRQIFDPNPDNRGAFNVVAQFYGVTAVPLYWLIDPTGKVIAAPADIRNLRGL